MLIRPVLRAPPMGWNWATRVARSINLEAVLRALDPAPLVLDRASRAALLDDVDIAAAAYLDNYTTLGHNQKAVNVAAAIVVAQLHSQGLPTREVGEAEEGAEFIGLEITSLPARVSIKRSRGWRPHLGIEEVRRRNKVSGLQMEMLLGRIAWALLVRRWILSLLDACYAFAESHRGRAGKLWDAARRELAAVCALTPLFALSLKGR